MKQGKSGVITFYSAKGEVWDRDVSGFGWAAEVPMIGYLPRCKTQLGVLGRTSCLPGDSLSPTMWLVDFGSLYLYIFR